MHAKLGRLLGVSWRQEQRAEVDAFGAGDYGGSGVRIKSRTVGAITKSGGICMWASHDLGRFGGDDW